MLGIFQQSNPNGVNFKYNNVVPKSSVEFSMARMLLVGNIEPW